MLGNNAQNLAGAVQGAEGNVLSNPAYVPSAPTKADYDGAASAQYGTAVYKGADGTLYDSNGQPLKMGGATAPDFFAPLAGHESQIAGGGAAPPVTADAGYNFYGGRGGY